MGVCNRGRLAQASNQPHPLQARMPVLADDDVVVHRDAERGSDLDDCLGHMDVGLRGRRIATRMVVQQATGPTIALMPFDFHVHWRRQGAAAGGGKKCLCMMIPYSRHVLVKSVSLTAGHQFCRATGRLSSAERRHLAVASRDRLRPEADTDLLEANIGRE